MTPLHMALVAAAVANDGVLMRPYLVERLQDRNGKIVSSSNRAN
ncbi:MAG: penicillin-binding transpeptidase domain-containing protein [Thermomicrobiales bacterium]